MRGIRVSVLLAALSVLAILGVFSCGTQQRDEKVVFIDLEVVISEEKKGYSRGCFEGNCRARRQRSGSDDTLRTQGKEFYLNGERVAVASFRHDGVIPAGSYFVLGDGERSYDSRY